MLTEGVLMRSKMFPLFPLDRSWWEHLLVLQLVIYKVDDQSVPMFPVFPVRNIHIYAYLFFIGIYHICSAITKTSGNSGNNGNTGCKLLNFWMLGFFAAVPIVGIPDIEWEHDNIRVLRWKPLTRQLPHARSGRAPWQSQLASPTCDQRFGGELRKRVMPWHTPRPAPR